MQKIEHDLEVRCRLQARKYGWDAVKLEKNGHRGIPDDLFLRPQMDDFVCPSQQECHQKSGVFCPFLPQNGVRMGTFLEALSDFLPQFRLVEFKKDEHQRPRREQVFWLQRYGASAKLIGSYEEFCAFLGIPEN